MAVDLLRVMYQGAGKGGALLIGVDLQKDAYIIENAYNDSAGFNVEKVWMDAKQLFSVQFLTRQ